MDKLERGGGRRGGGAARERADGKGEVYRGLDLEQQLRVNRTSFPVLLLQPHASLLATVDYESISNKYRL